MALQPNLIACGWRATGISMGVRFLAGPAVMAAASLAIGLRGTLLQIAIVQVTMLHVDDMICWPPRASELSIVRLANRIIGSVR